MIDKLKTVLIGIGLLVCLELVALGFAFGAKDLVNEIVKTLGRQ